MIRTAYFLKYLPSFCYIICLLLINILFKMYMVAGNNLFNQWIEEEPILDKFRVIKDTLAIEMHDFNISNANLVNMCWSYNIFQCKNNFFITGMFNDKDLINKVDVFKDGELKPADLLAAGNDFTLYILNSKESRLCVKNLKGGMEIIHLDFNIDHQFTPNDLKVHKMVVSKNMIFFLTKGGYLYSGIPPKHLDTSYCIGNISDIVCGYDHYMVLTDKGFVYTWGSGQRLQLGHGDVEYVEKPKQVEALAGIKITKIAAGGLHSMALSEFGDVYVWGWNDVGQLGVASEVENKLDEPSNCPLPKLLDIYDGQGRNVDTNVIDIACGSRHSVIKFEDNTVWATGYNKYGQLGISTEQCQSVKHFRKVQECNFEFELICGTWSTVLKRKCNSSEE